jgi:acylglycerol lipase
MSKTSAAARKVRGALRAIAIAALLGACAHAVDPGVRAALPKPAIAGDVDAGDETFAGGGGVALYGRWWRPKGEVRAVLVVQHGLNDHGDRYAHLAEVLVARGYAVYALDLRGHGRSAGPRVEVAHFRDYLDDEAAWIERVRAREPGKPLFVFGHSMGGLIMTIYAEEHPAGVAGVLLSAPALGLDAPPLQLAGILLAGHLGAPGSMLPQRDADFSRDPAVVADMGRDPLLTHADGPTHTAVELVDGIRVAWMNASLLTAPLIVLHGTGDKLTSPAATRDFVAHAGSADKRHVAIADAWHDLAHDPARDVFEGDVVAWLDAHTGGAAFAAPDGAEVPAARTETATAIELGGIYGASDGAASSAALALRRSIGGGAVAWHGDLSIRIRDGVGIDLLPVGVAARLGRAGEISLAGGVRAGWPAGWGDVAIPARVAIELPLGPAHVFGRSTASWIVRGASPASRTLGADSIESMIGLRFGGERDFWSRVSAGSGPFVGGVWARTAGTDTWSVVIGIHLWGLD